MIWAAMARVALRLTFHDRLKTTGSVFGVVFALVLANQNLAIISFLLQRNTMFVDNSGADLWIAPPGTRLVAGSTLLPLGALDEARVTNGVEWTAPILLRDVLARLPNGGAEPITLIGVAAPEMRGGPWNMVAGSKEDLLRPDGVVFEDSYRERLGGLNLGDVRELNRHRSVAVGFTWGLVPFGPSFAFCDFNLAREIMGVDSDQVSFVLVKLKPGVDANAVRDDLQRRVPEADVITTAEFKKSIDAFVLFEQGVGPMMGTSTLLGIIVALAIVSLTMLSAVIDNLREFGTLKAMGATNRDLVKVLVIQSGLIAGLGSPIGVVLIAIMARFARSPQLMLPVAPAVLAGTIALLTVVCVLGSGLALARIRKLEPAMVFR